MAGATTGVGAVVAAIKRATWEVVLGLALVEVPCIPLQVQEGFF
jgi:hypothetical protein